MSAKQPAVTEEQAMVQAAGQIAFLTLLSRVTGLLRDVVIGATFGAGTSADAFFVAFRIPNLLRRVVGEGATAAAFVPVVTEYLTHRSRQETMEMVKGLFGVSLVILLVFTLAGIIWAEPLTRLFAPGFDSTKLGLTVSLTRITFLYLLCIGLVALATGVLHALRHFAAPAFAPILLNLILIFWAWWSPSHLSEPVFGLAYGVVLGGLAQVLCQIPALTRFGVPFIPAWQPRHPAVQRVAFLLLPVLFGAAVYQISLLVNTLLASLLPEGSVSSLWYASHLFEFPQAIFVNALGAAALPSLAVQAQRRDLEGVRTSLTFSLRLVNLVTIPAAAGLATLAVPITSVLFLRGAFNAAQVLITATVLQGFAVGLWSVAAVRLLSACFYALQDTRTPVYTGALSFIANASLSLMLMGEITILTDTSGLARVLATLNRLVAVYDFGTAGLALAASLAATVNLLLLGGILSRRLSGFPWPIWLSSLLWSIVASIPMTILIHWIALQVDWLDPAVSFLYKLGALMLAILAGIISFVLVVWPGGKNEIRTLIAMLPKYTLRFLPQFLQPHG
jgi:putative peptidoglycan lipid II flippase